MTITPGKFRMLKKAFNRYRRYWIIGALVGVDKGCTYVKTLPYYAKRIDFERAYDDLREEIHRDHPGIEEEFTLLRPKHSYN